MQYLSKQSCPEHKLMSTCSLIKSITPKLPQTAYCIPVVLSCSDCLFVLLDVLFLQILGNWTVQWTWIRQTCCRLRSTGGCPVYATLCMPQAAAHPCRHWLLLLLLQLLQYLLLQAASDPQTQAVAATTWFKQRKHAQRTYTGAAAAEL